MIVQDARLARVRQDAELTEAYLDFRRADDALRCVRACVRVRVCVHVCVHVCVCMRACMRACVRACMQAA